MIEVAMMLINSTASQGRLAAKPKGGTREDVERPDACHG